MAGTGEPLDRMAPWDAANWFQAINETSVTLVGSTPTKILTADPMRVALIFAAQAVGNTMVSTKRRTVDSIGMPLAQTIPPIQLLFSEVGPLVQMEWWAYSIGTPTITIWDIRLSRWPRAAAQTRRTRNATAT